MRENFGRTIITVAGLLLAFACLWAAQTAVNAWTEDAVWFDVNGGTKDLFTYVLGCAFGMIFAMSPWLNNAQTPLLARISVGVMAVVIIVTGMVLVTQAIPLGSRELAEFQVANGWNVLFYATGVVLIGIFALIVALTPVKPVSTQQ